MAVPKVTAGGCNLPLLQDISGVRMEVATKVNFAHKVGKIWFVFIQFPRADLVRSSSLSETQISDLNADS